MNNLSMSNQPTLIRFWAENHCNESMMTKPLLDIVSNA